jgi:type II secretory pathway predicted ATPase ExeA
LSILLQTWPKKLDTIESYTNGLNQEPFTHDDFRAYYVGQRLSVVGGSAGLFSEAAIDQFFETAQGIPRVINLYY